jgi:NAD(P)-dependent dehydrogenase (short-subunit alcohol dehydrogenase family)
LDVADFGAIELLAGQLTGEPIDVLINNAGIYGPKVRAENDPRQQFGKMDYDIWSEVIRTNTMAPLKMAESFVEQVAASEQKKMVHISSTLGSMARTDGGVYAYRSSKAAGNMVMATLAKDVAPRGIVVLVICPGWVKTAMGGKHAPIEIPDSIRGMRRLIANAKIEQSGMFTHFDGEDLPW